MSAAILTQHAKIYFHEETRKLLSTESTVQHTCLQPIKF